MLGIRRPLTAKHGVVRSPSKTGQGGFVGEQRNTPGSIEHAQILEVFPDTLTALVSYQGGIAPATLPLGAASSPESPSGGVALPYRGSEVLVTKVNGQFHIVRYVAPKDQLVLSTDDDARRFEFAYDPAGSEEGHYKNKGYTRQSGLNLKSLLPGDSVQMGRLGNFLAVLDGGINILRSHDSAQILTFMREQMVKIVASQYKLFTDFGKVEHITDDLGATLSVRGAGGAAAEASNEAWTIRGDLGARGDLVNLRVTDYTGFDLARVWVNRMGNVYSLTQDHVSDVMGSARANIRGALSNVYHKSAVHRYKDYVQVIGEKLFEESFDSFKKTVANNSMVAVMGESTNIVGGKRTDIAVEGWDIDVTKEGVVLNVGHDADAGSDTDVSISIKKGDFNVETDQTGDMTLSTGQGTITIKTNAGQVVLDTGGQAGSVLLGSSTAASSVVLYDQFKSVLGAMAAAIDSHVHTGSTGPTATPGQLAALVNSLGPQAKSSVVKAAS